MFKLRFERQWDMNQARTERRAIHAEGQPMAGRNLEFGGTERSVGRIYRTLGRLG